MTSVPYTAIPSPALSERLDKALAGIATDIGALRPPRLSGIVLGGGYGRGEGGVRHTPHGDEPYNDLDFFVFTEHASKREAANISSVLEKISGHWEKQLGVAVDFGPPKNLEELPNVANTLMFQELRRGWRPVWGICDFTDHLPEIDAADLPVTEAIRLLLNRGMGLLFAGNRLSEKSADSDFIMRNLNKSLLGSGDALLLAGGQYRWNGRERVGAFRRFACENALPTHFVDAYENAFRYKLEPDPSLPDDPWQLWRRCREFYLDAARRISRAAVDAPPRAVAAGLSQVARNERSVKNFLRWLLREHRIRLWDSAFDHPVVTVVGILYRLLAENEECPKCPDRLYRLWLKFN